MHRYTYWFLGLLTILSSVIPGQARSEIQFQDPESRYAGNLRFRIQNLAEFGDDQRTWQVRRLRLRSKGWVTDPKLRYSIQLSFSRADLDWESTNFPNIVRDAVIYYDFVFTEALNYSIGFGQTKLAGNRQRVISSGQLQFPDRSVVNRVFNIDRDFGFFNHLFTSDGRYALRWDLTTGEGRNLPAVSNKGLANTFRFEFLPAGKFSDQGELFEGDLSHEKTLKSVFGLTYARFDDSHRQNGPIGRAFLDSNNNPIRRNLQVLFMDALVKYQGYSLYLEWAYRDVQNPILNSTTAFFPGQGVLVQFSKMLTEKDEIATRFARVTPNENVRSANDPLITKQSQTSVGYSRYLNGHLVKFQSDLTYFQTQQWHTNALQVGWSGRLNLELGI